MSAVLFDSTGEETRVVERNGAEESTDKGADTVHNTLVYTVVQYSVCGTSDLSLHFLELSSRDC